MSVGSKVDASAKLQFSFLVVVGYQSFLYASQIIFAASSLMSPSLGLYSSGVLYLVSQLVYIHASACSNSVSNMLSIWILGVFVHVLLVFCVPVLGINVSAKFNVLPVLCSWNIGVFVADPVVT
jgi:hypothetical protein